MPCRIVTNLDKILTSEGIKNLTLLEAVSKYDSTSATSATVSSSIPPATTGETITVYRHDWLNLLSEYNYIRTHGLYNTYRPVCTLANGIVLELRVIETYYSASQQYYYDIQIFKNSNNTHTYVNDITYRKKASTPDLTGLYFTISQSPDLPGWIGSSMLWEGNDVVNLWTSNLVSRLATPATSPVTELINGSLPPEDPYGLNNDNTPEGGYGNFDYTSEDETPPSLPSLSAANAGFVTLWNPTISEVGDLADYLWGPTFSVATWQKLWNDPMECLLSLGIVPVAPTTGTRANIYFGNADTGIESAPITTQFVNVDMGSMHINGQSASYMDYAPYAKASIYLPYCGTYALDVDEIMDADLALEYHIDIYTGACVAYLTINNRVNSDESVVHNIMYQFTGNCLASIPVTSGDHSQLLQSLLFMGASIAATVATAGAGAASGGAIEGLAAEGDVVASSGVLGAASAINTVMSMKPNVMHSGNLSSTAGLLGSQKPFVTFTWSNLCRPDDEYQLVGMPIQKSGTLSDFEGFTIVSACHMDNILCTDAERSMIEQALGRGVII